MPAFSIFARPKHKAIWDQAKTHVGWRRCGEREGQRKRTSGNKRERQGELLLLRSCCPYSSRIKPNSPPFELFHLPLNILARSWHIRRAKPQLLPAGKFWLVPPPPSAQTLALPLSQARTGKGRERREKTTSKCSGAVFPLIRLLYLRLESCLEN